MIMEGLKQILAMKKEHTDSKRLIQESFSGLITVCLGGQLKLMKFSYQFKSQDMQFISNYKKRFLIGPSFTFQTMFSFWIIDIIK